MRLLNVSLNFLSLISSSFLTTLLGLFVTPYILVWLGSENYGTYRMLYDLFGYFSLLELGIYESLLGILSKDLKRTHPEQATIETLFVGLNFYIKVLPFKILAGILVFMVIPIINKDLPQIIVNCYYATIVGTFHSLFCIFFPFKALVESRQKKYIYYLFVFFQGLTITLISVLFAYFGWGIAGQFLALVLGSVPLNIYLVFESMRICPRLKSFSLRTNIKSRKYSLIKKQNYLILVSNICSKFSYFSDSLILGIFLGPTQVSILHFSQRLVYLAQPFLNGIGQASWGSLIDLHFKGDQSGFEEQLVTLTRFTSILGSILLIPICLSSQVFVNIWVGPQFFGGILIPAIASINLIFISQMSLWSWCFTGKGKTTYLLPQYILATSVNFTSSIIFSYYFKFSSGPLLGTLFGTFFVSIMTIPYFLKKFFKIKRRAILGATLYPILSFTPMIGIGYYAYLYFQPDTWLTFLLMGTLTGFALIIYAWVFVTKKREKEILVRLYKLKLEKMLKFSK